MRFIDAKQRNSQRHNLCVLNIQQMRMNTLQVPGDYFYIIWVFVWRSCTVVFHLVPVPRQQSGELVETPNRPRLSDIRTSGKV